MWETYLLVAFIYVCDICMLKNLVDDLIQCTSGILKGFTSELFSISVTAPILMATFPFVQV